ncbi:hypothetical protein NQ318_001892 [Aromia moschata]|uniref:Protein pygopus n=1 Tax=Aromia moschata TaxID=1265417 RepID=A0AAV8Z159_9CUCU|nr:hypothetical protein NQ318_001892 [Aromia moschata]
MAPGVEEFPKKKTDIKSAKHFPSPWKPWRRYGYSLFFTENMSSDSSDEDNLEFLKEAQDSQFINDSMFSENPEKSAKKPSDARKEELLPSLRTCEDEDGQFNFFKVDVKVDETHGKKREKSRVKLLSESKHFLKASKEQPELSKAVPEQVNLNRTERYKKLKVDIPEKLLKEVAVTPEDILSRKEVKTWSNRSKAPVFRYKKSENDKLVLTNDSVLKVKVILSRSDVSHAPFPSQRAKHGARPGPRPHHKEEEEKYSAPHSAPSKCSGLAAAPLSGYGDTIVASNPFDDCPSTVNNVNAMRNPPGPPMGMGGPGPNMVMGNSMGMYRPMCPNPQMGMGAPMMHSPNAHQMSGPMMMNGPRMNHMGPGPGSGHGPPPHMIHSPNGPGPGRANGAQHEHDSITNIIIIILVHESPPMHSPIGNMGPMSGPGPGAGGPMGSPMGHNGPMNGGGMNNPMNGPPMGGPHPAHGPHPPHGPPHGPHGGPGGPGGMPMSTPNGPIGPPMNNNNFIMSPMNNMYSKPMPVSAGKVYPADQPMVFNSQNPNAPPIYPCGVCHKEVHDNDQAILCESGCNFWFHRGCTGLTEAAFQLLTAEVYARVGLRQVPAVEEHTARPSSSLRPILVLRAGRIAFEFRLLHALILPSGINWFMKLVGNCPSRLTVGRTVIWSFEPELSFCLGVSPKGGS